STCFMTTRYARGTRRQSAGTALRKGWRASAAGLSYPGATTGHMPKGRHSIVEKKLPESTESALRCALLPARRTLHVFPDAAQPARRTLHLSPETAWPGRRTIF